MVSRSGSVVEIGEQLSAGGGFHSADDVEIFASNPAVTTYVTGCGEGDHGIYIVQHTDLGEMSR